MLQLGAASTGPRVKCPKCGLIFETLQTQPPSSLATAPFPGPDQRETASGRTQDATRDGSAGQGNLGKNLAGELGHGHLRPAQRPDELGRLGPYRVLKVLGKGGMGMVYQAEDPRLKRQIALKIILPHLADDAARRRFKREAQAQAALDHDHVITIHEVEEDNGVPYIAMPLLKGELLSTCLQREGRLPLAEVLRIGREMADGLAAAHRRKMIHRDIKPGNIWLERRDADSSSSPLQGEGRGGGGRVKILDFGLARLETATRLAEHLTATGTVLGTPAYMSPEQARGDEVNHRTDLFSLGCVLYQMATGELPFKGKDTLAILSALALHNPVPPHQINSHIPAAISSLVLRLLAKNPADRFSSAQEVVKIIRHLERSLPNTAPPAADTLARSASAPPATLKDAGAVTQGQPQATPTQARPLSSRPATGAESRPVAPSPKGWLRRAAPWIALLLVVGGGAFLATTWRGRTDNLSPAGNETNKVDIVKPKQQASVITKEPELNIKPGPGQNPIWGIVKDSPGSGGADDVSKKTTSVAPGGLLSVGSSGINLDTFLSKADSEVKRRGRPFAKIYDVKMLAGTTYIIDMTSDQFDCFLHLEDLAGKELAHDDDGGGGLNSRIVYLPPTDGVYRIIATSHDGGMGRFSLGVREKKQK